MSKVVFFSAASFVSYLCCNVKVILPVCCVTWHPRPPKHGAYSTGICCFSLHIIIFVSFMLHCWSWDNKRVVASDWRFGCAWFSHASFLSQHHPAFISTTNSVDNASKSFHKSTINTFIENGARSATPPFAIVSALSTNRHAESVRLQFYYYIHGKREKTLSFYRLTIYCLLFAKSSKTVIFYLNFSV